jgi:DNA-binding beta-propeller fold protein YncE
MNRCPHLPSGGIAVNKEGHVLVADINGRIQEFDSSGKFLNKWGSYGTGDGQFASPPYSLAVDKQGNIYVADGRRIQKFDSSGKFLLKWGSFGNGDGEFSSPQGIAIDSQGGIYVSDNGNARVQKFDSNGKFLLKWGSRGVGDGQFTYAGGVAVDKQGNIYVGDTNFSDDRVQKFRLK